MTSNRRRRVPRAPGCRALGVVDGPEMSGNSAWAVIDPIVVVVGLGVGLVVLRPGARRR